MLPREFDVNGVVFKSKKLIYQWRYFIFYEPPVHHYIEFRDMLPKSKVGKLLRREVRSEEKKRLEKGKWEETLADDT